MDPQTEGDVQRFLELWREMADLVLRMTTEELDHLEEKLGLDQPLSLIFFKRRK